MGDDDRQTVIDMWSRRQHPDVASLARRRVAEARRALGMEVEQFAKTLGTVLDWEPSPQAVESWEEVATPPGDVVLAVGMLAQAAPTELRLSSGIEDVVASDDRFADIEAVFANRSDFLARMPVATLFDGVNHIRAAGLSLNLICQQYSDRHLTEMLENGGQLQCLFLDPDGTAMRNREEEEGHPPGYLATLTSINILVMTRNLRGKLSSEARQRLEIRTYDQPLRYNILLLDDHLGVVQPYLHNARGLDAPTIIMQRNEHRAPGLLPTFEQVFTWLWERGTPHAD